MKKFAMFAILLCMVTAMAFAQTTTPAGEPHADVGDLMVNVGVNLGWHGIGLGGGAEYMFYKWDIPNFAPLTFGGAGKAALSLTSGIDIDLAALATMHFSLNSFDSLPPFLKNLDWYWGLGLGVGIGSSGGVGISTGSGLCYYLNPTLAINADYFYTNYFGSGSGGSSVLGIRLEL